MPRNDGFLTRTRQSNETRSAERKEEKQTVRRQLMPAADLVLMTIEAERKGVGRKLLAIIDPNTPDNQVASRLQAIRMYDEYLVSLRTRMNNILRLSKSEIDALQKESRDE